MVKSKFFAEESWTSFSWQLLVHSIFYIVCVAACLICSIISSLPLIISKSISQENSSIGFCFIGSFIGSSLVAGNWRRTYFKKREVIDGGEEASKGWLTIQYFPRGNLTRLILSGIILGTVPFLLLATGNIVSLLSITPAPLVYLVTFSTISVLGTSILAYLSSLFPEIKLSLPVLSLLYIGVSFYPLLLISDIATSIQLAGIYHLLK
jgi:hypothetical protein